MPLQKAPCGVKVGDIFKPGEIIGRYHQCDAVKLDVAPGLKFSAELGKPTDQRSRTVTVIYEYQCGVRRGEHGESPTCPFMGDAKIAELRELAEELHLEPSDIRGEIENLPKAYRPQARLELGIF